MAFPINNNERNQRAKLVNINKNRCSECGTKWYINEKKILKCPFCNNKSNFLLIKWYKYLNDKYKNKETYV